MWKLGCHTEKTGRWHRLHTVSSCCSMCAYACLMCASATSLYGTYLVPIRLYSLYYYTSSFLPRTLCVVVSMAGPPLAPGVLFSTVGLSRKKMLRPTSGCLSVRQPLFACVMFSCLFIVLLFRSFLVSLFPPSFLLCCCDLSFIAYLRRYHGPVLLRWCYSTAAPHLHSRQRLSAPFLYLCLLSGHVTS
ncbi:hypothetical protein GGR55DRAFT_333915 [Xylaria sp. FL0064]|nr:hypothetical protein GGR55DRAFT_333915 [Xylaria sp. FL0064]